MYNWWSKRVGYSINAVKCFMQHSMEDNRLPQTYGLFLDNEIIGMYQFAYDDLSVRPDIYPFLIKYFYTQSILVYMRNLDGILLKKWILLKKSKKLKDYTN